MKHRLALLASCAALTGFLIPTAVNAQTKIEQMIVTATKRALDVQQVPASISAFSGENLQERQVKTFQDLLGATPNVQWATGSGNTPNVAIRGVSPDGPSGTLDPTVAMHVDGVYQPRVAGMFLNMLDLDSIEVMRGPQGTVYGRNANAGVINFNTKRPTDTFEAGLTVFGGSYNRWGARGYVSGPVISDKVEMRLAATSDRHDGWGKNRYLGTDSEGQYNRATRLSIRLKPVEDLTVDIIGSHSVMHAHNDQYAMAAPNSVTPAFLPTNAQNYQRISSTGFGTYTLSPWESYSGFRGEQYGKTESVTGIITWDVTPDITVKSVTGQQHSFYKLLQDLDSLPYNYITNTQSQSSTTFSQEFNLNAKLWDRLDLVAGLYYLRDHNNGGLIASFHNGFTVPNLVQGQVPVVGIHNELDQRSSSKAVFLDATVSITDQLRFLGGVRRTFDKKKVNVGLWYETVPTIPGQCRGLRAPNLEYTSTTGRVGLQYDFTPEITGYVQWQNGFKTGGYNPAQCSNPFSPEKIESWEAGVKSRLFDDTVSFNVTVFNYDYSNLQLSRTVGLTNRIDNAAKAKIRGAEIETVAYLTDDLRTDLSVGFLDTKYQNYGGSLIPGGPFVDVSGLSVTKAPKVTLNWGLEYTMRIGDLGELKTRAEYAYRSKFYFTPFHEVIAEQGGYSTTNLFFTFTPDDCPYEFQVFARNLFDKAYRTGVNTTTILNYSRGYWGDPRLLGVEASVKF